MNKRLYSLTEATFDQVVKPLLLSYQDGRGRPPSTSHYQFFLCGTVRVKNRNSLARLAGIVWQLAYHLYAYTCFKRWSERGWFWQLVYDLQKARCITLDIAWGAVFAWLYI